MSAESKKHKRDQVLEAARRVVEQFGIRKLTLEDVARQAGLGVSSLYYYFANKNDLIRAIAELEMADVAAAVEANVAAAEGLEDKIAAVGRTVLSHARQLSGLPGLSRSERQALYPEVERELEQFKERIRTVLQALIEQGNRAGVLEVAEPEMAAFVIAAGIRGLAEMTLDGEITEDRFEGMERMSSLLMNGLKKR